MEELEARKGSTAELGTKEIEDVIHEIQILYLSFFYSIFYNIRCTKN
jgi:hypothetical protein